MSALHSSSLIRNIVAGALLTAYAGGAAWLVRSEGMAHRQALLADQAPPEPASSLVETTPPVPPPAPERKPVVVETPPVVAKVPDPKPPAESRPPAESKPAPSYATLAPRPPDPPRARAATPEPSSKARRLDPFWERPENTLFWDVTKLKPEEGEQMVQALNQMVLEKHRPQVVDGPLPRRLEDAAEPYLKLIGRKASDYKWVVLDCDEPNAFSHPGGYIYVCRGLLELISTEEPYALEFIILHEMAHLELGHAFACLSDPALKKLEKGTVQLFYGMIFPWGYKEEQDLAADEWARRLMGKAGRSRRETLAFLNKLEGIARTRHFENVRRKPTDKPPEGEPFIDPIDNHIRAHPIPRMRIKELKAKLEPTPKS